MNQASSVAPRLAEILPSFAEEIEEHLRLLNEQDLAIQVSTLIIIGRCHCKDDFCGMFYTKPHCYGQRGQSGQHGQSYRCVVLEPKSGVLALDVVSEKIVAVEVLYRDEIRDVIYATVR